MEFLGTLLWDLMIRFDERCFLLGELKWVENHQLVLLSLGPQQLAGGTVGGRLKRAMTEAANAFGIANVRA